MKWLNAAINGEVSLVKTFWPGAIGYFLLNSLYLFISSAVIAERTRYENAALSALTTWQLVTPPLILLFLSIVLGLYTTLAAASIWQSADKYPVKQWAFWPNLSFLSVLVCLVMTSAEIMFSLSLAKDTLIKILANGGM